MNLYEFNLLVTPKFSDEQIESFKESFFSDFKEFGELTGEANKEQRKLAYEIEGETNAWLLSFYFSLKNENLKESLEKIEKKLKENENILRYLILSKKQLPQKPKIIKKEPEKVNLEKVDQKVEELLKEEA